MGKLFALAVIGAVVAGAAALASRQSSDLKRYVKMERM